MTSNQVKYSSMIITTTLLFSFHRLPTTWPSSLEHDGSSCPAFAAPDLPPLLPKDLRVTTSMNHTPNTIFSNESKLRAKHLFSFHCLAQRESTTFKLIIFHYLAQAKRIPCTASHRRKNHPWFSRYDEKPHNSLSFSS